MPRCEGCPEGPFPAAVSDNPVRLTQGDLMLCPDCDKYRFPPPPACSTRASKSKSTKQSSGSSHLASKSVSVKTDSTSSSAISPAGTNEASQSKPPEDNTCGVTVTVNELLSYVSFYRNSASKSALSHVCASFYSALEVSMAKKCLIADFHCNVINTPPATDRRSSTSR